MSVQILIKQIFKNFELDRFFFLNVNVNIKTGFSKIYWGNVFPWIKVLQQRLFLPDEHDGPYLSTTQLSHFRPVKPVLHVHPPPIFAHPAPSLPAPSQLQSVTNS